MIKKSSIWGICLVFTAALSFPAFADQSIGYQHYFKEGVKAFNEHEDQKAFRCFKIAQIYDPDDDKLNKYLDVLEQRGIVLELQPSRLPADQTIGYRYYFGGGVEAFENHDDKKAIRYFKIARIFNPDSAEADRYLRILFQRQGSNFLPESLSQAPPVYGPSVRSQAAVIGHPPAIAVRMQKASGPAAVLSLTQITSNGQIKPALQIELNSSVIIEGKNIQRFLVVDEGYIGVKIIDPDRLGIDAQRIGSTFLHIWDDLGRQTLYIQIVFPQKIPSAGELQAMNGTQHSQPFRFTYANDWSTYYSGKNISVLKRQNYDFTQSLSLTGETPYGIFDASGSYIDFNSISEFDSYTVGLSQIPLEGTSNFNLRGFDALRYLSPLTMSGTRLRGVFADVDLMGDVLGLSVSHGRQQEQVGFITMGGSQYTKTYIDAVKLTLFPKSDIDRYSFNFATAYGPDRQRYLSDHVYSLEGQHKFNPNFTLNAEEAGDTRHDSTLASFKWQDANFKTELNFRNVDKNYTTISSLPAYQGETQAAWTTDSEFKNFRENTFVEVYRDRLNANPDNPSALNYDAFGQFQVKITQNLLSDTDFNFVDTQGDLSPRRSLGLNERLSRGFGIWNSLKGTVFGGAGYQYSHSKGSDISDFNREDVIAGIQLPLTSRISAFANYEYDFLDQPNSGGNSNPTVINAGFEYSKQFTPKISINSQVTYRNELGVNATNNSFLSGEQSVILSSGFAYNPTPDVSFFGDANASRVMSHIGNLPYDDFEAHLGVRITFGGATYWDPLGTVSGIVFKDRYGNGKYVAGDEGIPGVKVKVGDKEAVTDKSGRYRIKIRAKGVTVIPELDTIPGGLIFSTPQSLNVEIIQGRTTRADFGLISQTGIYGIIFVDNNGSGIPKEGDQFIGKVKVILDGKIIQKSDYHGAFYFRQVSPGQHTVSIDLNTLALNLVPLIKLENKIDVAEGTNYMFNIPVQVKKAESEQN